MLGGRVRDAMVTSACLYAEDLDIVTALQDLWTGASIIAKNHDLTFNEIAQTNLEKLDTRARKPHTITHLEEGKLSTFARRKRMLLATLAMKD